MDLIDLKYEPMLAISSSSLRYEYDCNKCWRLDGKVKSFGETKIMVFSVFFVVQKSYYSG